ncbi:hypothetical protein [Fuerstiella marisgermanici]|uniref:Uncharacterized protein n=1 Tax=Fuerstiella marisgermanici TaxID=1891926 RepID=A0A1P8WNI6_9PLAN|nr:hypothetical protein [Fuerstiella marisgermanici]APZ95617.1 hypothetical protein Fuma_05276 [Fuerstiella marisgermanici]
MNASSTLRLPYEHLNLRRNPFGELSLEEWATLAIVDVEAAVHRLRQPRHTVQFIGEKGYGKTTHLLAIRSRFPDAGYVHIPEGQRAAVPAGAPIIIDEAQRLTWWQRLTTFRAHVPLVLGTHRDFTGELLRSGRTVETIRVEHATNAERLQQLLNARIEKSRRDAGAIPSISSGTVHRLLKKYGPDIRSAIHEMYVTFQSLNNIRCV